MASERIKLFEADIDTDGIIKKSVELKQQMTSLALEQQKLKATVGETSEEYIKNEARVKAVSKEYRLNQLQVSNLASSSNEFFGITQKLVGALDKEVLSIANAKDNNKELRMVRDQLNAKTEEGAAAIEEINRKIDQNTAFIKSNVSELEVQKINIGDYKNQIKDAYSELNIFNGGISGFIGRAQQAGGVTKLLTNTTKSLATGIWGMTKASLAFIATPIGLVLASIGLVVGALVSYLKSAQGGMDKLTSITRPLMAILESLRGVLQKLGETMFKTFTNPKKALTDLVDYVKNNVMNRFKAFAVIMEAIENRDFKGLRNGIAQAITGVENLEDKIINGAKATADFLKDAAAKGAEIDRLQKEIEQNEADMILRRAQLNKQLKEQETIAKDQSLTDEVRTAAIQKQTELANELVGAENKILDLKIQQEKVQQSLSDSGRKDLTKLNELLAEQTRNEELLADTKKKNLGAERQLRNESVSRAEKAFEESIKRQETELKLFIANQGEKARTLQEQLLLAEEISKKEIEIEERKYKAGKISKKEFDLFVIQSDLQLAKIRSEIVEEQLDDELQLFKDQHQSRIEENQFLNETLYNQELERIDAIAEAERERQAQRLEEGIINAREYNQALREIDEENTAQLEELNKQREAAKKEKEAVDLANKREIDAEKMQYDLDMQFAELDRRKQQEIEAAEKTGADIALIEQKYAQQRKQIEDAVQSNKLSLMSNAAGQIAGILGEQSMLGKAAALSQVAIDTYASATAAYKALAGIPIVGPGLGTIAAGAAITSGLANAKKIASTKLPKAEKGMVMNIGGKRHSSGGTKFYGEDGTAFEAEKDEKMFILNRQASAALGPLLSDINQQYGGASLGRPASYLAAGGQVLRNSQTKTIKTEVIDYEKLTNMLTDGVRRGSMEGTSKGAHSGIVDREDNIKIAAGANF